MNETNKKKQNNDYKLSHIHTCLYKMLSMLQFVKIFIINTMILFSPFNLAPFQTK